MRAPLSRLVNKEPERLLDSGYRPETDSNSRARQNNVLRTVDDREGIQDSIEAYAETATIDHEINLN